MDNLFGNRLASARKMAGISLQGLADALQNAVTKQALNKYEQGKMKPDSGLLIDLSRVLKVPVDYFFMQPRLEVRLDRVSYRKFNTKISKTEQASIEERACEVFERYLELENTLQLSEQPEYFTFDKMIRSSADAEEAAQELRRKWQLGYDPIPNVVGMLEDKGYLVIELEAPEGFDGLKADIGNRKVIVLKKNRNPEDDVVRKRFTALHELAHHALKYPDTFPEKEEETLCHVFACAVLYPEEMANKELQKGMFHFYQNELILIKERWGISFPAVFNRAKQLGLINEYIYRRFNQGYRERQLHLNEPGRFLSKEQPVRFERLIYQALSKEVISINKAAYFAGKPLGEFREQLHQLARN